MVRTPGAICSAFEMRDFGSEQGLLDGCQASHTVPHPGDSVTGSSDVQSLEGSDRRPHTNEHTEFSTDRVEETRALLRHVTRPFRTPMSAA